jgi:hypothetical protein
MSGEWYYLLPKCSPVIVEEHANGNLFIMP